MFASFDTSSLFGDIYDVAIEIYVGNQLVQSDSVSAPRMIVEQNYLQLVNQIIHNQQPMSVKMIRPVDVYDENDNYVRTLFNSVESFNYMKEE